ncbi:MAG: flagellar hook-basal body complex protein FliE [Planctomycetota bacterium]
MNPIASTAAGARIVGAQPLSPGLATANSPALGEATGGETASFKNLLVDSLQHVNGMQQQADQAVEALFTGGDVNTAEVLTAVQKADMAFRLTMQVRNKLMDVYREIQEVRI